MAAVLETRSFVDPPQIPTEDRIRIAMRIRWVCDDLSDLHASARALSFTVRTHPGLQHAHHQGRHLYCPRPTNRLQIAQVLVRGYLARSGRGYNASDVSDIIGRVFGPQYSKVLAESYLPELLDRPAYDLPASS